MSTIKWMIKEEGGRQSLPPSRGSRRSGARGRRTTSGVANTPAATAAHTVVRNPEFVDSDGVGYVDVGSGGGGYVDVGSGGGGYVDVGSGSGGYVDVGSGGVGYVDDGSGGVGYVDDGSGGVGYVDDGSGGVGYVDDGSGGVGYVDDGSGGVGYVDDGSGGVGYVDDGNGGVDYVDDGSGGVGYVDDGSGGVHYVDVGSGGAGYVDDGSGGVGYVDDGSGGVDYVDDGSGGVGYVEDGSGGVHYVDVGSGGVAYVDDGSGGVHYVDVGNGGVGSVDVGSGGFVSSDDCGGGFIITEVGSGGYVSSDVDSGGFIITEVGNGGFDSSGVDSGDVGSVIDSLSINTAVTSNSGQAANTPTTPTTSHWASIFDSPVSSATGETYGTNIRSMHKRYPGFDARSVKIIWEQHDQTESELSEEVCTRVAEDATYKLWELVNNIKTYARHSGGTVTYDLVNEVLRDSDVPPMLGAMDSDWERIDYDGSFFFYSNKIIELRDEYQKEVNIEMPEGKDIECSQPAEENNATLLQKYITSLLDVVLYGEGDALETALDEAACSPAIGPSYRMLLAKLVQIFAFKQNDTISQRCWSLLRACSVNGSTRYLDHRTELFHLSEILICQLLAPYESIKLEQHIKMEPGIDDVPEPSSVHGSIIKMEMDEEFMAHEPPTNSYQASTSPSADEEAVYKLVSDDDDSDSDDIEDMEDFPESSPYFSTPVDWTFVDELCETLGHLAAVSGFLRRECTDHIVRRLERFTDSRLIATDRDFNYLSRAIRGLIALGEHSFREFIPFVYKFDPDYVPESLWNHFALGAAFLRGSDDIFLHEWLECLCGADKLQPFMVYSSNFHEKLLTRRWLNRKKATFYIPPVRGVRRLEWNTLAAAMCQGDDPYNALKPKPTLHEEFPKLVVPNLRLNRPGQIHFKFAGCRNFILNPKQSPSEAARAECYYDIRSPVISHSDILIARRKLLKPLTNEQRVVPLTSYHFARI